MQDMITYQNVSNCSVKLSKSYIDSASYEIFNKELYGWEFKTILNSIYQDIVSCLPSKYSSIRITDCSHTLFHILSYKGDEENITRILQKLEYIDIKVDAFGKSPIYYAIMMKHLSIAQLFLSYFLEIRIEDKQKRFILLSRIQNEFTLLIKSSFIELPRILESLEFESDYKIIPEISNLPLLHESESYNIPYEYLKPNGNDSFNRH